MTWLKNEGPPGAAGAAVGSSGAGVDAERREVERRNNAATRIAATEAT